MNDIRVTPQSWLWRPRTKPVRFIEIHATRGSTSPAGQRSAALNWVQSARNVGNKKADGTPDYANPEWGSSFSYVIGTDGSMGTVLNDDQMPIYSAGYGGPGSTYAIDEYGISYELAQSAAQEPFTEACYQRAAKEVAAKCKLYGIPAVFLTVSNQSGSVPTGLVRHDRCQNGYVLGKSDPGNQFDEGKFLALVRAEMQEDIIMTPEQFHTILTQFQAVLTQIQVSTNHTEAAAQVTRQNTIEQAVRIIHYVEAASQVVRTLNVESDRREADRVLEGVRKQLGELVQVVQGQVKPLLVIYATPKGQNVAFGPYRVEMNSKWLRELMKQPHIIVNKTEEELGKLQVFPAVVGGGGGTVGFSDEDLVRLAKAAADEQYRRLKE